MEKYYKASDIGALVEQLLRTRYWEHEGESWYSGVSAVWDGIIDLPVEETDINELKKEVADLNNRRHLIWALGVDYDGCNTVDSLKELIDELVSYTQLPREQIPDITSRTGRWLQVSVDPDKLRWKCSSCGKETDLPNYEKADFCFCCGAKMTRG